MARKVVLKFCVGLAVILPLAGAADNTWKPTDEFEEIAQLLIEDSNLKDPFSVRFRKVFIRQIETEGDTLWCGQINAKNSYGAYGGFDRFYLIKNANGQSMFVMEDEEDAATVVGINTVCAGALQAPTVEIVDDCGLVREATRDKAVRPERPSQIRARHILLNSEETALEAISLLQAGGSFADIAKSKSIGPSAQNGGDLGWFRPGDMPTVFSNALLQLDNCEYDPAPLKTEFGWHVILRLDSR